MNIKQLLKLIIKYNHAKEWEKAKCLCLLILKENPRCYMAYFLIGINYYNNNILDEAETAFLNCIKYYSKHFTSYINLVYIYNKKEDYEKGFEIIYKALKIFPNEHLFYIELSNIWLKLDKIDMAINEIIIAIKLNPESETANYNYALILNSLYNTARINKDKILMTEYYSQTIVQYFKVLQINMFNINVLCNIGSMYALVGDNYIEKINQCIDIDAELAKKYNILADNYYMDAELKYLKALECEPNDCFTHYNLGIVLTALKDYKNAKKHYSKVIEIEPDHEMAHKLLEELEEL